MIFDVHSHAWDQTLHMSDDFMAQASRGKPGKPLDLSTNYEVYRANAPADSKALVFGGKAKLSGVWIDDDYIAKYVAQDPKHLIGFLSIDPTQPNWEAELKRGHLELGMRGVKLLPMYAGFKPDDGRLDGFWEYVQRNRLPVLLHTGTTFIRQAPLDCTQPILLDRLAMRYPEAKMILAHLSHPYEGECVVVIRKHPNLFADVSALYYRPFQLYQSLMLVQEYGMWHKILFGTDFPFTTVNGTVNGLMSLNNMLEGTALPRLDVEQLQAMIHRDAGALLGLG